MATLTIITIISTIHRHIYHWVIRKLFNWKFVNVFMFSVGFFSQWWTFSGRSCFVCLLDKRISMFSLFHVLNSVAKILVVGIVGYSLAWFVSLYIYIFSFHTWACVICGGDVHMIFTANEIQEKKNFLEMNTKKNESKEWTKTKTQININSVILFVNKINACKIGGYFISFSINFFAFIFHLLLLLLFFCSFSCLFFHFLVSFEYKNNRCFIANDRYISYKKFTHIISTHSLIKTKAQ